MTNAEIEKMQDDLGKAMNVATEVYRKVKDSGYSDVAGEIENAIFHLSVASLTLVLKESKE